MGWDAVLPSGSAVHQPDPMSVFLPLTPVFYISSVTPLPLPPVHLSRHEMIGTWHGAGNATLTLRANGTFVARDLPEDLRYDAQGVQRWSGSGLWVMSNICRVPQPGICVTVDKQSATTLETSGSAFLTLLWFPNVGDYSSSGLHK